MHTSMLFVIAVPYQAGMDGAAGRMCNAPVLAGGNPVAHFPGHLDLHCHLACIASIWAADCCRRCRNPDGPMTHLIAGLLLRHTQSQVRWPAAARTIGLPSQHRASLARWPAAGPQSPPSPSCSPCARCSGPLAVSCTICNFSETHKPVAVSCENLHFQRYVFILQQA